MKIKVIFLVLLFIFSSCSNKSNSKTNPQSSNTNQPSKSSNIAKEIDPKDVMAIEGDLGTIDKAMVQKKFDESKTEVENCIYEGMGAKRYLGGTFYFMFRIKTDGTVKKLSMKSTTGNRKIEKCIYDFAKNLKFVKPKGGEAKVAFSWGFEAPMQIQKHWTEENLSNKTYSKLRKKLYKCSDGTDEAPSEFTLIFYVIPDAKVTSIGVSTGGILVSDKFFKCVKKAINKVKFPDPMGTVAKVTLSISPN